MISPPGLRESPRPAPAPAPIPSPAKSALVALRPLPPLRLPPPPKPMSMSERMSSARERIRAAANAGQRMRSYEVALDVDMSEFHFARQFRAAFGRSPHAYYDEVRAERARDLLREGLSEGEAAKRVGLRRPAELRALLSKCEVAAPAAE